MPEGVGLALRMDFKSFILGIAQATADATKGVNDHEATAIEKLQDALV